MSYYQKFFATKNNQRKYTGMSIFFFIISVILTGRNYNFYFFPAFLLVKLIFLNLNRV